MFHPLNEYYVSGSGPFTGPFPVEGKVLLQASDKEESALSSLRLESNLYASLDQEFAMASAASSAIPGFSEIRKICSHYRSNKALYKVDFMFD
jgi:hypothetical protein